MGDAKYEELILDAIDQLRKRKARPDLDRICHMLERRHGLKGSDVNDELSRLVNDGIVIKVDYKGNTSYRNAAKWVRTKSQFFGSFFNSSDISAAVLEAVDALSLPVAEQASPITKSASIHEIERYLLKRDAQSNLNIATLRAVLEKEVANGSIKQLPSGDFITKRSNPSSTNLEIPNDSQVDDPCRRNRLINAKKRLKTTHENGCVETPGVISSDLSHESCCDYCLLTANANRKGVAEELLVCKDCNAKAHPSCMDYNTELAARSQLSPWQCTDCKTCTICEDSGDGDLMLFCDLCDKGYHMNCHIPSVTTKPTGKWVCAYCCSNSSNKESHSISTKNASSSDICVSDIYVLDTGDPLLSAEVNDHFEDKSLEFLFEECLQKYPDVIPLAESWSIEDVEAFFKCIGYQEEAPAFKEQEIDGQSLLLMKRSDVLTGLSLKLGPALKIYNHIKRLQGKLSSGHFA